MRLALRELIRRPAQYVIATGILLLIATLVMFFGGLLDGLINNSIGAVRSQRADVIVYSESAQESFLRSRIDSELRATVESVDGVEQVGGIGIVQLGARRDGADPRDLLDTALFGYELAPRGVPDEPPADGDVIADRAVRDEGVREGDVLLLGPARSPVTVVGFTEGTNYLGQSALWASASTWRTVLAANRPDAVLGDSTFQSLVVRGTPSARELADAIDDATGGATVTLDLEAAANAIPGVQEQRGTFSQIINTTVLVALVIVGLFFVLLTVEKLGLYGVLKAIGAGSGTIFAGVLAQAAIVTVVACVLAGALAFAADAAIPAGAVPFEMSIGRFISSSLTLLVAAVIGCVFSLRRVLRVDPAQAIGGGV
jgi:putative ABC transport system permease protein